MHALSCQAGHRQVVFHGVSGSTTVGARRRTPSQVVVMDAGGSSAPLAKTINFDGLCDTITAGESSLRMDQITALLTTHPIFASLRFTLTTDSVRHRTA